MAARPDTAPTVVLLHGLWMGRWQLELLARRLRSRGFVVKPFAYASITERFAANLKKLLRFVLAQPGGGEVHLVGHSLGGVLAARLLKEHHARLPPGRLVALGSPLTGAALATRLRRLKLATVVLGFADGVLGDPGIAPWTTPRAFGVIAGRTPIGASLLFGGLTRPHDGTVTVAETQIEGLTDHVVIGASHTSLVFSAEAADLTARFLRTGSFAPAVG